MATTTTTTATTGTATRSAEEYLNKMYDSNLNAQKAQLQQNYNQGMSELDTEQQQAKQQTQQNLKRTYVEAAQAAKNYGEVQKAYGLTSGAMAQAKLAQDTTLQQDMTALRGIQMNADADIERQRTLLAQQYQAAIAEAQQQNDMARAEALYKDAATREQQLLEQQQQIASLFAARGDYSYYQKLYGLTDEQLQQLMASAQTSGGGGGGGYTSYYSRPTTTTSAASGSGTTATPLAADAIWNTSTPALTTADRSTISQNAVASMDAIWNRKDNSKS